jgi:hypothetical protein
MRDSQDTDPRIVLKKRWALRIGWIMVLAAPLLLAILLVKVATGEDELGATVLIAVVPVLALLGIYLAGTTTTVTFHTYTDSMTVIRGSIPLFMWWRRTKRISRQTARTAFVTSVAATEHSDTLYQVEVITPSGDALVLFTDNNSDTAEDLAVKIGRWGGVER